MPKFRYRMQNILDIKLKLEEQAKNEYAQAQLKYNEELEVKEELCRRKNGFVEKGMQLREDTLDVRLIRLNDNAIRSMDALIEKQETEVKRAEKNLDAKQAALTQVMQERKMHEKLKEKALEEYNEEEKSAESKTVDELTSYIYGIKEND